MNGIEHSWSVALLFRPSVHSAADAGLVLAKECCWRDYHAHVEFQFSAPSLRDFDRLLNEGGWIHVLVIGQVLLLLAAAVAYELIRFQTQQPTKWYRIPMAALFAVVMLAFAEHLAELYSVGSERQALSNGVFWLEGRATAIASGLTVLWVLMLGIWCLYKTPEPA